MPFETVRTVDNFTPVKTVTLIGETASVWHLETASHVNTLRPVDIEFSLIYHFV